MKSLIAAGLVLCAGIVGSLAPVTSAYALPINHAGSICHPRYAKNEHGPNGYTDFTYGPEGIFQRLSGYMLYHSVICPLVVQKDVSGGLTVDVSVEDKYSDSGTTTCTLYSHNWTGKQLGYVQGSINPPSQFVRLSLNGNQTAFYGYYTVTCILPQWQTLTSITVLD